MSFKLLKGGVNKLCLSSFGGSPAFQSGEDVINFTDGTIICCDLRGLGFVADEESIMSHAMLYAKALKYRKLFELNLPRNVIKDGEKVELDTKGCH
jgi:hypothetical protein